jgi:hypothetical protein
LYMEQVTQEKTDGDVDGFFDDGTASRARGFQRFWSEISEIVQNGMKAH